MQVLDRGIFLKLKALAKSRGVTVQELIRVLVIPDWMRKSQEEIRRTEDRRRHRRLAGPARGTFTLSQQFGPSVESGRPKESSAREKHSRVTRKKIPAPLFSGGLSPAGTFLGEDSGLERRNRLGW